MKEFIGEERRITRRLMHYWETKRGARSMPAAKEINGSDLGELWEYSFIAEVDPKSLDCHITYMGSAISPFFKKPGDGASAAPVNSDVMGAKFAEESKKLVQRIKPIIVEGTTHCEGVAYKYRQILLPLGENKRVTAIFGGMRFLRMVQDSTASSMASAEAELLVGYKSEWQAPSPPY